MKLGNVQVDGLTVLAPMAGYSDSSFRLICREQGVAIVFSEMVSADGLIYNDHRTRQYLQFTTAERPIAIQIFGSEPDAMAKAAKKLEAIEPDFIDLNFSCPVKKVIKRGAGAALLKDLSRLQKMTRAVTRATSLPILAKIRSGWDEAHINAVEAAKILVDCGVCAITIHPRTQTQLFRGYANWEIIKQVKQAVSIPVIGNGDIKNPNDAKKMLTETCCDMIMIGRAALGNPWLFKQINYYLETNSLNHTPILLHERQNVCLRHLELAVKDKGEYYGVREMRKQLALYIKGLPYSSSFRATLFSINQYEQVKQALQSYFRNVEENYV